MAKRNQNDEDAPKGNLDNTNDADSFGLPDIEYKPIERVEQVSNEKIASEQQMKPPVTESYKSEEKKKVVESYSYSAPEGKSGAPVAIAVVIIIVVAVAGFLIYNFVYKPKAEKEKQEQLAKVAAARKAAEEARLAQEREEAERKQREAEEAAKANATPAEGTIEILSAPTKRYYVVITSAVDADLVMDYAKKLSAKGVSSKVIPPYGKWKFNRLSIGDYDTFDLAQTSADIAKAEYGDGVWVIKY